MSILNGGLAPWYWNTLETWDISSFEDLVEASKPKRVEIIDMSNMSPEDAKKRVFGSITSEDFDNKKY